MMRYVAGRIARLVLIFLMVTLAVTALMDIVPGDPAFALVGEDATQEQIDAINARFGFNDPYYERYVRWLGDAVQGDLGASPKSNKAVAAAIKERIPVTIELAFLGMLMAAAIAVPLGVFTGYRQGGRIDRLVGAGASAIVAAPSFVFALVLVWVFAVKLGWFPVQGWTRISEDPFDNLKRAVLPVLAIASTEAVILQRVIRADIIQTLNEDFVFAASAKGIPTRRILFRHALRPSLFSAMTVLGIGLGRLIGGTVIIESIFGLPGLGSLLLNAINTRDLVTVQGVVAVMAVVYLIINLIVDVMYSVVDPRVAR
jgi:peptide/nickel transport system permease protein